ncbi:MAG: DUF3341 domain-containing protein, partial [Armatimonadetes bacterium]|nr:DUF3341 domain-containing protein [Armatimonadota bacterium]
GIGAWGLNHTVGWGFDITNFVFWIGIGHAGTLISAVLYLFRQKWRTSINRAAEAMTIFAVMCAGIFPLIHMGRPWFFYWILPYPNNRGTLWVNFRSPLLWDFFAISTYFTISLVFWYVGLIPDLATLRDRTQSRFARRIFGVFSLGWDGSARSWHRYETVYGLLALLATPLVVSVHSIVSFDFATSIVPGWHTTIFPPYFVIGAIFSGFAMVLALLLITRKTMKLENYITPQHLNWMCKVMLLASCIMGLAYGVEFFIAWYSANPYELGAFINRATGPYAWAYWTMVFCNVVAPQMLWMRKVRQTPWMMFIVCLFIIVGMWFERFVIIVTSLHRDFLPSSWAMYHPTGNEFAILVGMFGLFFALFLLFTRVLPVISIAEIKGVLEYGRGAGQEEHPPHHGPIGSFETQPVGSFPSPARPSRRWLPCPCLAIFQRRERRMLESATGGNRFCIGHFESERDLLGAVNEAHQRKYRILDAFTPYPVHGLPEAMRLGPSRLIWIGFWAGALGLMLGLVLQYWTSATDWPLRVGGQPFNSWPVFVPVTFELTVLFAGLMGVAALIIRARLSPWRKSPLLRGTTDDRFALAVLETDASAPIEEIMDMLRRHRALNVVELDELSSNQ